MVSHGFSMFFCSVSIGGFFHQRREQDTADGVWPSYLILRCQHLNMVGIPPGKEPQQLLYPIDQKQTVRHGCGCIAMVEPSQRPMIKY